MARGRKILKITSVAKLKISKFTNLSARFPSSPRSFGLRLTKVTSDLNEQEAREVGERQNTTPAFGMLKRDGKVYTQIVKTALQMN